MTVSDLTDEELNDVRDRVAIGLPVNKYALEMVIEIERHRRTPVLSDPDIASLAELREYVATVTGLNSTTDPQTHEDSRLKPVVWVRLLDRLIGDAGART